MKKSLFFLLLLTALILCACTSNPQAAVESFAPTEAPTPTEASVPSETPPPTADPAPETPTPTEDPAPETPEPTVETEPVAGTVKDGVYRSDFYGICFSLDNSWIVLSREEIAQNMGYNEDYAAAEISEVLSYHVPYVDLWATNGTINVQIMAESPPITVSNGSIVNSPAAYMDYMADFFSKLYENARLDSSDAQRFQQEFCGYLFEVFRFDAEGPASSMTETMMVTEKDGYFLTIYITCIGEDRTEAVFSQFSKLPTE